MTLLRVAIGLARNSSPEHRWRRLSVFTSAVLFMTFLLGAASIAMMVHRETDRDDARTALLADPAADTDLFVLLRPDHWRGRSILVAWVTPTTTGAKPALPPGLKELPTPGQAVVSPALDRLAARHPELAARFPRRTVVGWEGVRSGGELFAYARPAAGRQLGSAEDAVRVEDSRIVGDGPVFRVGRFGPPGGSLGSLQLGEPRSIPLGPVLGGLAAVLVIPGVIILVVGGAAASGTRSHRLEVMRALGAGRSTIGALSVVETLVVAAPGLLIATVAWGVVGPRLDTVPLVGYEVAPRDLALPLWLLVSLLVVGIGTTALVALLVVAVPRRRHSTSRPTARRSRLSGFRALPVVIAVTLFAVGKISGGYRASDFYLLGFATTVVAIAAVLPAVLRALAVVLRPLDSPAVAIASRTMEWDPTRAARPFVAGAALLFLVLAGSGYLVLGRQVEAPPDVAGRGQSVTVEWEDPQADDLSRFGAALGTGLTVPFVEASHTHEDHGHEEPHSPGHTAGVVMVGATCQEIALYLNSACDPMAPSTISPAMEQTISVWLEQSVHGSIAQIRLVPRSGMVDVESALVLSTEPIEQLDQRVRNAAYATLPAPYVRSALSSTSQESPLVPWLTGGFLFAVTGLALACLLSLVDRFLGLRSHHRQLVKLGISRRRLTQLAAWTFAIPYAGVFLLSFVSGSAVCAVLLLPSTPLPWTAMATVAALVAALGALGTASVALLDANSALPRNE